MSNLEISLTIKADFKKTTAYAAGFYFGYQAIKYVWWKYKNGQVRAKGNKARADRDAKTFNFRKVDNEEEILKMDVTQLRQGLLSGKFSSEDLVNVFASRCYTIGRHLCLSTEENFEEALREAMIKDAERETALHEGTADELPPLHGIPMSIKDLVRFKKY